MSDFDLYYGLNPVEVWDQNRWTIYDPEIAYAFRMSSIFTPLVAWVPLENNAPLFVTGRELLPGHVNHEPIGLRQRYTTAAYMDSRQRQVRADYRYGGKVQFENYDELINMWRKGGTRGFIEGILRQHLNRSIVETHEKLSRDAFIENVNVKTYAGGASDFSGLSASEDYFYDIKEMRNVKLRLSVRAKFTTHQFGTYANPVPGSSDLLVITSPAVVYQLADQMEGEYMQNLRDLRSEQIMNGGAIRYQGVTYVEDWNSVLWNAGAIVKQVAVTQPITAGDGAPDPSTTAIDGTWYVGQNNSALKHYLQCSDLGTGQFKAGDFISLHTVRTNANGVTDGCDPLDGRTMVLEVLSVDEVNERLVLRQPVMDDYSEGFSYTTLAGSGATGTAYAFVTKAAHIHPVIEVGARGAQYFAMRRGIQIHTPPAIDDFQQVHRITWDLFGGMNKWNGDLYELHYTRAPFANRGAVGIA